jgi:hypothetical protein
MSKEEQNRRLLQRVEQPAKRWKFSLNDIAEHSLWDRYMECYQAMIRHTSTQDAPWYVVPADNKWFSRLIVAAVLVDTLDQLGLKYPVKDIDSQELDRIRQALTAARSSQSDFPTDEKAQDANATVNLEPRGGHDVPAS